MEALLMSGKKTHTDWFEVDWSIPNGTESFVDRSGRVTFKRQAPQAGISIDPYIGACTSSSGYGGWLQTSTQYPIDLRVSKWTLTIDTISTQVGVAQTLISQAIARSGTGGWYLSLTANAGRFDFYWQDAGNVWRVLSTTTAVLQDKKLTVKVVRNGASLSIYLNDVLSATTSANVSFNNAAIPIAIGQWADGLTNTWYGKIGKITFTNT